MPRNARLRPDKAPVADLRRPGDAALGDKAGIALHLDVVSNLDEIVDLRHGTDVGPPDARTVDRRIGADFDAVANLDDAQLRDFLDVDAAVRTASVVEAVAVAPQTHAAMDDAIGADDRALAQGDLRINVRARADAATFADEDLRLDDRARTYRGALLDHGVRPDMHALAQRHARIDKRRRVHARRADGFRRSEQLRRRHAGMVGVGHAYDGAGRPVRPVRRKQNGRSLRPGDKLDVFGILAETQVARSRFLKPGTGRKVDIRTFQRAGENLRELTCLHSSPSRPPGAPWQDRPPSA